MMNETLKKILAIFLIAFVIVLTMMYVKKMPAVMKIVVLAVDVVVFYLAYTILKTKPKKEEDELEN